MGYDWIQSGEWALPGSSQFMATRHEVTEKKAVLLDAIRAAHRSGQWAPGEAVPALTELATRYGLSKRIVNEELDILVEEGLLYPTTSAIWP